MLVSVEAMRFFLAAGLIGLAVLAIFSLRRRGLTKAEWVSWGLLAVLLPVLGPFLVISSRPGKKASPTT